MSGRTSALGLDAELQGALEDARTNIGEWLLQNIAANDLRTAMRSSQAAPVGGEQARRIAEALERLIARIEAGERRLNDAAGAINAFGERVIGAESTAREESMRMLKSLSEMREVHNVLTRRIAALERGPESEAASAALRVLDDRLNRLSGQLHEAETRQIQDARRFDSRVANVDAMVRDAISGLNDRIFKAEADAIRSAEAVAGLESSIANLDARIAELPDSAGLKAEAAELRAQLEERIAQVNDEAQAAVAAARYEFAQQMQAAAEAIRPEALEEGLAEVNRRLASIERRYADTLDSISTEIKVLHEAVDRRLKTVEERAQTAFKDVLRHEMTGFARRVESRFDELDRRQLSLKEELGGRMSALVEDLTERAVSSEERAGARLADALSHVSARLLEIDERLDAAVQPLQYNLKNLEAEVQTHLARAIAAPPPPEPTPPTPAPPAFELPPKVEPPVAVTPRTLGMDAKALAKEPEPEEDLWTTTPSPSPEPISEELFAKEAFDTPSATASSAPAETANTKAAEDYLAAARRAAGVKPPEPAKGKRFPLKNLFKDRQRLLLYGSATAIVALAVWALLQPSPDQAGEAPVISPGGTAKPESVKPAAPVDPLEAAAAKGDPIAQYDLALQRYEAENIEGGLEMLRKAADQGLAVAQYRLAKSYERGEGVEADLTESRRWTERAAEGGNRSAMHDLGVYYARGEGAPFDETAAFRWFKAAAELGVAQSQFNLARFYEEGRGVRADLGEAYFWYLVSAASGAETASDRAAALAKRLAPAVEEVQRQRSRGFRPAEPNARANGEFGPRPWAPAGEIPPGEDQPPVEAPAPIRAGPLETPPDTPGAPTEPASAPEN